MMLVAAMLVAGCGATSAELAAGSNDDDVPLPEPGEACEANTFLGCDGDTATACDAAGVVTTTACEAGCNAEAARCNECVPSSSSCAGDSVETCSADGVLATTENCSLGCDDARCKHIVPAFLPTACDTLADSDLTFTGTLDTSVDANCTGGIISQPNGPEICVVHHRTITLNPVVVRGQRAIAFVADNDLSAPNSIDVSANGSVSGPGGGRRVSGLAPTSAAGGTGAGFKQVGGSGGTTFDPSSPPGGGTLDPLQTGVFEGGARSAGATTTPLCGAGELCSRGGGGGGPLMLVSCRGTVSVTSGIDAGGGGGSAGGDKTRTTQGQSFVGGAGGGAGGYVVIQGARVEIAAELYANGGGGGGSCGTNNCTGAAGEDAVIGVGGGGGAGSADQLGTAGGAGGRGAGVPGNGQDHNGAISFGGGGGSVGRIQIFTPVGSPPTIGAGAIFQPLFETNGTVELR